MIRAGLPQPWLVRLRQHWERLCLRWERTREETYARTIAPRREQTRTRRLAQAHAFMDAHDNLVETLCAAAHANAPEAFRLQYRGLVLLYRRSYRPVRRSMHRHWKALDLPSDPFKALCCGDIEQVIHHIDLIEVMTVTQQALGNLLDALESA